MFALLEQGEKHNQFEIQDLVWGKFFPNNIQEKPFWPTLYSGVSIN